jgi:hypothetical protein
MLGLLVRRAADSHTPPAGHSLSEETMTRPIDNPRVVAAVIVLQVTLVAIWWMLGWRIS